MDISESLGWGNFIKQKLTDYFNALPPINGNKIRYIAIMQGSTESFLPWLVQYSPSIGIFFNGASANRKRQNIDECYPMDTQYQVVLSIVNPSRPTESEQKNNDAAQWINHICLAIDNKTDKGIIKIISLDPPISLPNDNTGMSALYPINLSIYRG